MQRLRSWTRRASIGTTVLVACLTSAARHFDLSSLDSDYAPAARIWGITSISDSTLVVRVDSVLVAVPGARVSGAPPSVGEVKLRVLLAVADSQKWRPLELSEQVPLADTLRFGEQRMIRGLGLAVARPRNVGLDSVFLVFELRGQALGRVERHAIARTYVCSADYVRGSARAARARAALLAQAYTRNC